MQDIVVARIGAPILTDFGERDDRISVTDVCRFLDFRDANNVLHDFR